MCHIKLVPGFPYRCCLKRFFLLICTPPGSRMPNKCRITLWLSTHGTHSRTPAGATACAYFSHHLSPAERHYDIGNRELLAFKLALEGWRHWLKGWGAPFIFWTDHKNLEYIKSAKRLNSRQALWALFFGRFDFSISYLPGSKNIKPDVISYFRPFWVPVFFRAHCATELFCFCSHMGDWIDGPHGLTWGESSDVSY